MNAQFAGTNKLPSNNVLAAIGCTFANALRCFKKVFKEKTGIEWENRAEPNGAEAARPLDDDFLNAPFRYYPPMYGPGSVREARSSGPAKTAIEMSRANGSEQDGLGTAGPVFDSTEAVEKSCDNVLDKMVSSLNGEATTAAGSLDDIVGGALDYPFGYFSMGNDENIDPTQQMSFHSTDLFNSFTPGIQEAAETQLAEQAQGELEEFLNLPDLGSEQPYFDSNEHAKLDLGPSILKRRAPAASEDQFHSNKKARVDDVTDSFE